MAKDKAIERDFLQGQLLIAMPSLRDPRFEKAVVFLCEHDADHAFGLIVNKPLAEVSLQEIFDKLEVDADDAAGAGPAFFGGPVGMDRGAVLHTMDYRIEGTVEIGPDLGLTLSREIVVDLVSSRRRRPPPRRHLFAVGYAGWGAGQLESELAANAWAHCCFDASIVFAVDPDKSWEKALSTLGVTAAMLAGDWLSARRTTAPLN